MATLIHSRTNSVHILDSSHRIGRDPTCQLRLTDPQSSWEHALISWTGQGWEIRDLGTSNGTTVDEYRLEPRENVPLRPGAVIVFGAPDEQYHIRDVEPPQAHALADGCAPIYAEDGVLCLPDSPDSPDSDDYEYMIREDGPGRWQLEDSDGHGDGSCRPVVDGARIACAGRTYTLHLPFVRERTWRVSEGPLKLAECTLQFLVTRDAELVKVQVQARGQSIELAARSHSHLLLLLGRQLENDRRAGLAEATCGWINRQALPELLGMPSDNAVNVAICRARNQLRQAGIADGKNVIESSGRDSRKVRLAVQAVAIQED